jgi:large-conductance mechanosensitive channel
VDYGDDLGWEGKNFYSPYNISMNSIHQVNNFKGQLTQFIADNNIVGTAAGVSIAIATKDIIQSFVGDIVIPLLYTLLVTMNAKYFTNILPHKTKIDYMSFSKQFITWLLVIIITYLFIMVAFRFLLGVPEQKKEEEEKKAK